MKLGCHCVLFRERIATETEFVLTNMAATGFQGVEMGARFFGTERKDELKAALEKAGIELAALHVGVPMDVWQNEPEKAIETVLQAARFIVDFPNKNLTMSASPCDNLEQVVAAMNKAAIACREMDVRLNYHTPAAEFNVNDAAMYKALRDHAPDICFGFDLGWIQKGGYDLYEVLEENRGRVSYVHLRDFGGLSYLPADAEVKEDYSSYVGKATPFFPDLGGGETDFKKLLAYLKEYLPEDGWAIVEYETGEQDFDRYTKAKAFLDAQMA